MRKVYNKLVRNKIPDIIQEQGKKVNYRVLSRKEYQQALKEKLIEEANELLQAKTTAEIMEELVDIQDVLLGIQDAFDLSWLEIEEVHATKRYKKGSFSNQYFLESVEE